MKNIAQVSIIIIGFLLSCGQGTGYIQKDQKTAQPPVAKKIPKELSIHDHTRVDNYYWLNERENPEVIQYLEAENAYTEQMLAHTDELKEQLYNEMVSRVKQDDASAPYFSNGYYYYDRYEEGNEYPIYCRKKGSLDAAEEVMLNVNELAKGYDHYRAVGLSVSPDNKLLIFGEDTLGRRQYSIRIKDLETGETYKDLIPHTTGGGAWANDNQTVFYTLKEKGTLRPYKIFRHKLGTGTNTDAEIFHEKDATFGTYAYRAKSGKYIMIGSRSTVSDEYRFLNADNPEGAFKIVQPRERGLEYSVEHYKDKFYILTNLDAQNFRLMETSSGQTAKQHWKEVIPHDENILLQRMEIFKNYLVVSERQNGLSQLRVLNLKNKEQHYIGFEEEAYVAGVGTNEEFDTDVLRFEYSSLTTPNSVHDYNMNTRERELKKQEAVLGDFSPENYESKRLFTTADDGTKIPISLVYRKGIKLDGNNPLLLYGYGSYGNSREPSFSSVRLSILDRGFVYALAHIRGGQEMGRYWYEDGKLLKKKNTFTDFIDCAEYLIEQKYTSKDKLCAFGGSAGGLLMGAVINLRPDLFKAVIAAVPFVDVVTTMLDESIPLTTGEFDEWGNPKEKAYYDYILSYSPYDNIEAEEYPALLVTTGLHDSQVQYWEPAKWVAKLREMKTDSNLLLLEINMEAGHSGAAGRFKRFKDWALYFTFLLDQLGVGEDSQKTAS